TDLSFRCSVTCGWRMGSFVFTSWHTSAQYLRPLFRHQLPPRWVPVVLQRIKHPNAQLYCTDKEKGPPEAHSRRSNPRDFTLRQKPAFPKSVFAAGTAKRTADLLKRRAGAEPEQAEGLVRDRSSLLEEIPGGPLSAPEWRKLKECSPRPERFEVRMMELMLAAEADINIAKSLLAYVAVESGAVPYVLLLRYLALCVSGGHHSEVLDTYDVMRRCFKTLDIGAYSLLVKGLSQTERWRETLAMLEDIKRVITPSTRNYGDAIAGAFLHGDSETGWMLYRELMELGLTPNQDTWQCLFENAAGGNQHRDNLVEVLTHMRENQVYPEEPLAQSIKAWFERTPTGPPQSSVPDETWRGSFSSVDSRGRCRSCQAELESIALTEEEYAQLKHRVMTDVIEGRDVFNKTTPEVPLSLRLSPPSARAGPYDRMVLDGTARLVEQILYVPKEGAQVVLSMWNAQAPNTQQQRSIQTYVNAYQRCMAVRMSQQF
ncbi:hypothetical protein NFI96_018923, partial [Prochilodus magdalenae]